jgi:uncharacterized protein (DUF1778 family)
MSDFIVAAALEKAEETMASIERWQLDDRDSRFILGLLAGRKKNPALKRLLALSDFKSGDAGHSPA